MKSRWVSATTFAALFSMIGGGCTTAPKTSMQTAARAPASDVSDEDKKVLDDEYEKMILRVDAEDYMKQRLDQLISGYYRAGALVDQFDADLDTALAAKEKGPGLKAKDYPMAKPNYGKILKLFNILAGIREKVVYFYAKMIVTVRDKAPENEDKRKAATRVLSFINKKLRDAQGAEALALHELLEELRDVARLFAEKNPGETGEEILKSDAFVKMLIGEAEAFEKYINQPDVQEDYNNKKKAATKDPEGMDLSMEEKKGLEDIKADIERMIAFDNGKKKGADRSIAGDKYYPNAGKTGNFTGNEFTHNGMWALTFDDGPHASRTQTIYNNLIAIPMKATFFWLAQNVKLSSTQAAIKNVVSSGMTAANHSYSHPQLTKQGSSGLTHEIDASTDVEKEHYGKPVEFFRCPYGDGLNNATVRGRIAKKGMIHVFWNVDTLDWQDKNATSVYNRAVKQMKLNKRGIVLFHDIHSQSVTASGNLMKYGVDNKLTWLSMVQIRDIMNGKLDWEKVRKDK